jgi:hypothetical protein
MPTRTELENQLQQLEAAFNAQGNSQFDKRTITEKMIELRLKLESMRTITSPICNLNGSSPDRLLEDNRAAYRAVRAAREALQQAAPHGRDYQISEPGAFQQANAEHCARLDKLNEICSDLEFLGGAIADQLRR